MGRTGWRLIRVAGALLVLGLVGAKVGAAPFLEGLRAVRPEAVLVVMALTALTTLAAAWRWQAVARSLGDRVPLRDAVGAYYRSQFLNSVLPAGVAGDVHRGVARGRRAGDLPGALRAVGWDRLLGQAVQVAVAAGVLLAVGRPPAGASAVLLTAAGAVLLGGVALALLRSRAGGGSGLAAALPRVVVASVGTTAGHAAVFLVAAEAVGVRAAVGALVPIALLVLVAMALPLSVAGWGVREGAAAWLFGSAGLGPDAGVAVATAYGTMALVAVLPGGALLLLDRMRSRRTKGSA
jgi:uncharacterized membrane protein YbhN (UPF0104 family)